MNGVEASPQEVKLVEQLELVVDGVACTATLSNSTLRLTMAANQTKDYSVSDMVATLKVSETKGELYYFPVSSVTNLQPKRKKVVVHYQGQSQQVDEFHRALKHVIGMCGFQMTFRIELNCLPFFSTILVWGFLLIASHFFL
jgi:hypothetical protein